MFKAPLIPSAPLKEDDILKWAIAITKALQSIANDLMSQLNWPVISTAPTETPTRIPCIKLYQNGSTYRLYIYYGGSWKYVALT